MNPPFQIGRFDHITLIVSDLEQTRDFYLRLLGLHDIKRPDFDFPGAWFGVTPTQIHADIHATVESDLAGISGWGDRKVKSIARGHHFAFEVDNALEAEAWLRQQGVSIASPPKLRPDGPTQFYIFDPDQHVVELFSFPKPAEA